LSNEVKPYTVQKILLLLSHLWGGEKRKNTSSLFSLSVHYIDAGTSEHNRVYSSMLLRVQTVREKHISNERERGESTQAAPAFRNEMMRGEEKSEPPTSSSDPQLKFNNDAISH
jgi:hypothetical protein